VSTAGRSYRFSSIQSARIVSVTIHIYRAWPFIDTQPGEKGAGFYSFSRRRLLRYRSQCKALADQATISENKEHRMPTTRRKPTTKKTTTTKKASPKKVTTKKAAAPKKKTPAKKTSAAKPSTAKKKTSTKTGGTTKKTGGTTKRSSSTRKTSSRKPAPKGVLAKAKAALSNAVDAITPAAKTGLVAGTTAAAETLVGDTPDNSKTSGQGRSNN